MDRDLVVRAQRGEEAAFAALLTEVADRLHATACHIVRDGDVAADAVQQAMIEMWRKIGNLREPERFLPWACRIVVRSAYAEAERYRGRRGRVEPQSVVTIVDESPTIDDRDELDRALGRLSDEHRAALVLKHYAGLSNLEIAEALAIPEGTVRSRLFHGLAALRAALDADRRSSGVVR